MSLVTDDDLAALALAAEGLCNTYGWVSFG
jgi:hypothetical protein